MASRIRILPATLVIATMAGCSPTYLLKQGYGQLCVLAARRPVAEVIADPATSARTRERLQLIADVRAFGESRIGLARTRNYETFVDLEGRAPSYVVTACPADSLEPRTWWFPIVGAVPYLGFFDPDDARAERDRLQRAGYDVHLRTAAAYSTLGIFADPVFSNFVETPAHDLADLILHETTHATVWVPGSAPLNESLADVVGEEGALAFLTERHGADSPEVRLLLDERADQKTFREFLGGLHAALQAAYARDLPRAEKLQLKAAILELYRRRYRDLLPQFRSARYRRFLNMDWNNAVIAAFAVYHAGGDTWRAAYEARGRDLRALLEFAKEAARQRDPEDWVRRQADR